MATQLIYTAVAISSVTAFVFGQTVVDLIHYDILDGKSCTDHVFETVARSATSCAVICVSGANCHSLFFTPGTNMCVGCGSIYNDPDLASLRNKPGSLYYRPYATYNQSCSNSEKPCIENNTVCFPGLDVCVCDPDFVYDPTRASCQVGCDKYGQTYQRFPNHVLADTNGLIQGGQLDVTKCLSYCSYNTTFPCFSVDYNGHSCYYNSKQKTDVPHKWSYAADGTDIYVRNCA